MFFRLFLCVSLLSLVYCDCVIMKTDPNGPPVNATGDMAIPALYGQNWTGSIACPEFQYVNSCCNANLNTVQAVNFGKLTSAFGNTGAGCDVCAANLIRFFCYYSCSPNQSDFMVYSGTKNVTVTNEDNVVETILVAVVNVSVNADMACGIYESCSKVSFMTEISAGASALGFISFLFDRGTDTSFTKDYVTVANTGGMFFGNATNVEPPHMCNETFPNGTDAYGYAIPGNCSCNYCSNSCSPLTMITYGNLTDGFNLESVLITYIVAIVLTLGCTFFGRFNKYRRTAGNVSSSKKVAEGDKSASESSVSV